MKFICLGYIAATKAETMSDSDRVAMMEECWDYDDELGKNGHMVAGQALQSPRNAATLRYQNGAVVVTDGPYAETKEYIGGVLVLEAKDISEAVELMSKHPSVQFGCPWEVRSVDEERLKRQPQAVSDIKAGARTFACLGYIEDSYWHGIPKAEQQAKIEACTSFDTSLLKEGHWLSGLALLSPNLAKTVRPNGRNVVVTDGPFAETKEQLGGLVVIAARNTEDAVQLMSQHPCLCLGVAIEVRPIDEVTIARWEARQSAIKDNRREATEKSFA